MTAFIRKVTALKCPVHLAIVDIAQDSLVQSGYFNKDEVLRKSGFTAMSESIRWDYIIEFIKNGILIQEDLNGDRFAVLGVDGDELIPLAQAFWNKQRKGNTPASSPENRKLFPQKYIAMGHGKKTAGYALVNFEGGHMALRTLKQKEAMKNGVAEAFQNYAEELVKRDLIEQQFTMKIEKQ